MEDPKKRLVGRMLALLIPVGLLWAACAGPRETRRPPSFPEEEREAPAAPPQAEGSLWPGENQFNRLFSDTKAQGVGDIVTVLVVESATASGSATTATSRDSSVDADITHMLELDKPFRHRLESKPGTDAKTAVKGQIKSEFEGSGDTTRSGRLNTTVAATVVEVFPNGNLRIEGQRELKLNNERQYIMIRGVVRPRDLSFNNTVRSTAIADARIEYSGKGVISDKQRPGWLIRILDWVWPF